MCPARAATSGEWDDTDRKSVASVLDLATVINIMPCGQVLIHEAF